MKNFWKFNKNGNPDVKQYLVLKFLEANGYRNIKSNKQWRLVKIVNHIVDFVDDTIEVRKFLIDSIKSNGDFFGKDQVIEQTLVLFKNVKKTGLLDGLSSTDLNLVKGDQKTTYKFFRNCTVKITANSIDLLRYSELEGNVLRSSIIDKEFTEVEYEKIFMSDFPGFLYRCMGMDVSRYRSFMSILGYLSSSYKCSKDGKAVIFCDGLIDESPEGGTGKSLTAKALSHFNNTVEEDGKNFKFTNFSFQQVDFDTELLIIDDTNKKLNFENLFYSISDGFQIEKKYQDKFTLSYEDSPKILLTTNYTIYGRGYSFERRIVEVEFSDYYGRNREPLDDFEGEFFSSWDNEKWNLFNNFMIRCVQYYLGNDKLNDVMINDPIHKRMLRETNINFLEFAEAYNFRNMIKKSHLYSLFLEEYPEFYKWLKIRTFNAWLKNYFITMKIEFEELKRDGGQRYWYFPK